MKLKLKENLKKEKNRVSIGFILIIFGLILILAKSLLNEIDIRGEEQKVHDFIEVQEVGSRETYNEYIDNSYTNAAEENKEEYIAVIEIPKINLKKGLYSKTSILNDVNKNIQILNDSDLPDTQNGNVILAAHSGTGKTAYFNNLIQLEQGDVVYIYYNKKKYVYEVDNIYEIDKTGKMELESYSSSILILITCNQNDKTKQIVFICKKQ